MRIMTDKVHPDEACWGYFTGPKQRPGYSEAENPRMLEQVFVIRGDAIACYERDFGPYNDFIYVPPLVIPSVEGENPVGECMDAGERHRNDPKWAHRMAEYRESSTLMADIVRQEEMKQQLRANRSNFGPVINVQRNDTPRQFLERRIRERRKR